MKAQTTFSLKDQLFNAAKVDYLAARLESVYREFPAETFRTTVISAFPGLELKQRIAHMTETLRLCLPTEYRAALAILLDALPAELDPTRSDDDYGDFIFAPFSLYVAVYGCTTEHLAASFAALREMTKRFSAEDAIRYFLNAYPTDTLTFLRDCARDDNYHVRRLASEGSRPLLPWAQRLKIDYREPLPILDLLFSDPTRYVTRSVANHLNDISKIDPHVVIETLARWQASGRQTPAELSFITKHALRTLVKRGDARALELVGFESTADLEVVAMTTSTARVRIGDAFHFSVTLASVRSQSVLLDYVMTFAGNGRSGGRKVFKLKQLRLAAGESVTIAKTHPMRLMTTRRLYPGEHTVTVQANGRPLGTLAFELVAE